MHKLSFLVKSYIDDITEFKRLLYSFNNFNKDCITLFCIVPELDLDYFKKIANYPNIEFYTEESIFKKFSISSSSDGYINQQIIKLSFYKTNLSENYFCIDSDAEFVRDFYISDFLFNEEPYLFVDFDNDRYSDISYFKNYGVNRTKNILKIKNYIDLNDVYFPNIHGMATLNSNVLKDFELNFLKPNNLSFKNILKIAPLEFSWYMAWVEKKFNNNFKIHPTIFKTYHTENDVVRDLIIGTRHDNISKNYIGAVVNSNFSKRSGNINIKNLKKLVMSKKALLRLVKVSISLSLIKLKSIVKK